MLRKRHGELSMGKIVRKQVSPHANPPFWIRDDVSRGKGVSSIEKRNVKRLAPRQKVYIRRVLTEGGYYLGK